MIYIGDEKSSSLKKKLSKIKSKDLSFKKQYKKTEEVKIQDDENDDSDVWGLEELNENTFIEQASLLAAFQKKLSKKRSLPKSKNCFICKKSVFV